MATCARRKPPGFCNVDLEIESKVDLACFLAEWQEHVFVLYAGRGRLEPGPSPRARRHLLALEVSPEHRDPDAVVHAFCALVEHLSPNARRVWDQAVKRFDVGYRFSPAAAPLRFALRPDTLARLTALGASVAVTIYRDGPDAP